MITIVTKRIDFQREYKVKHINEDVIILFRVKDFYITYCDDADTISKELGITRNIDRVNNCSTALFPTHKLDEFLPRIIRKGHRVAICDGMF